MPGFLGGSGATSSGTGGEIKFPKEFIDPVTKLRISNPENLIDTDFEYGLQPTKWETVELINNTPSFFSKSGDTTIPGITSISTNAGTREIIVTTALDHGLAVGIPINVQGTKAVTADGSYIINSIPDTRTFTYLAKDIQDKTLAIEDLYTSIITGEFFQGSQLRISDSDGIVTNAGEPDPDPISTLTVTTDNPHGFGPNTPFYFLNLNSTISQEFEAANTAAKSFDASNSATAQTFDGSNTLSSFNIDWSNSAVVGGTPSTITSVNTTTNQITVSHTTESFSGLPLGTPLYYDVDASSGVLADTPRGVVFLNSTGTLDVNSSTFTVSETPNGDDINLLSNVQGIFQIANQASIFAGNNVNSETETIINVVRDAAIEFEGANDESGGGNGTGTITGFASPFITLSTDAGAGLDLYVGAMVLYTTAGGAASGLSNNTTYFIASYQDNGDDTYTVSLKDLPTDGSLLSVSGGSGTQQLSRIGVSVDKDIVHIKNSFFSEKDMLEYEFPVAGAFEADQEQSFYFVSTAYDQHNYQLNPVSESFITATGGDVVQTVDDGGRNYTVHRYTSQGTTNFVVTDAGTFNQDIKYVIEDGSFNGESGAFIEGSVAASVGTFSVTVNAGGRVDIGYPQDGEPNNISFSTLNPSPIVATGGSTNEYSDAEGNQYKTHTFTSVGSSTFSVQSIGNLGFTDLDYLVLGGGGGGGGVTGNGASGGGGAGGMVEGTLTLTAKNYAVVVGGGGNRGGNNSNNGGNGGNSSLDGSIVALGGGGGGGSSDGSGWRNGSDGGCGGGGGGGDTTPNGAGGQGLQPGSASGGFGFDGGGSPSPAGDNGGGGGGAGQRGFDFEGSGSSRAYTVPGGAGRVSSITGTDVTYGGGGGSFPRNTNVPSPGGAGGGGAGGQNGTNGLGGGGGGRDAGVSAGNGGSGVVIVRYRIG